MWFSITISVLLVLCLVLYFVFSRKLKVPTIATEIMTTKYNKKIKKLERFCKSNRLTFDKTKYISTLTNGDLTEENLILNVKTIQNIASNFEDIEGIYFSNSKIEAQTKIDNLKQIAPLKIFADELTGDKKVFDVFETFNIGKTKLDFEFQKYFGSQLCVNLGDKKAIILSDDKLVVVDDKNIFDCKYGEYKIEISNEDSKNLQSKSKIFKLKLIFENTELVSKDVLVDNKNVEKYLSKTKYFKIATKNAKSKD